MPVFYLNICEANGVTEDLEGYELSSVDAALRGRAGKGGTGNAEAAEGDCARSAQLQKFTSLHASLAGSVTIRCIFLYAV